MQHSPLGHISSAANAHFFGLELQHVVSLNVLTDKPEEFLADIHRRQVDFLSGLIHSGDERVTMDLRMISFPDPKLSSRGQVRVALLCRMSDMNEKDVMDFAQHVGLYLEASFPEYHFNFLPAESLEKFLRPFSIQSAAEITRQCEPIRLDTLRNAPRLRNAMGFGVEHPRHESADAEPRGIVHISPFLFPGNGFERLFKLLLLEPQPLMISVMIQPAALREEEAAFIEHQITIAERFAQVELERMSHPSVLHASFPTLRDQARAYQQSLARMLATVQPSAALMQIRVASPASMQPTLVHALASLITQPAGGKTTAQSDEDHRAGGYDAHRAQTHQLASVQTALSSLAIELKAVTALPAQAQRLLWMFDPINAACAFRLPPPPVDSLPGVTTRSWRTRVVPPKVPNAGTLIGTSEDGSQQQLVYMGVEDRRRHVYVIGQTGTGKTTLLKSMILSDIQDGDGVCVIDPHGDMFKELLTRIPTHRIADVVVFDPTDAEFPIGLNLLECQNESERHFIAQEMVAITGKLIQDEYGAQGVQSFAGPMFFQHVRNNLLLAMSKHDDPGTLLQFYMIFQDQHFWRRWLPLNTTDPILQRWTKNVLPQSDYTRPGSEGSSLGSYVGSKFEPFVFDPLLRNIFGQQRTTVDFGSVMDEGKILLVNLAKGEMTEANSRFLGLVIMAKLQAAVMERARIPKGDRRDFNIYVDEFQSIATQNFITLLSEGRKFRVNLTLATQFITQVDPTIIGSILGNVGTIICFRLGQLDAEQMEKEFFPFFNRYDLMNLPNWHGYMTTLMNGEAVPPFSFCTALDTTTPPSDKRAARCRAHSRKTYGKPRQEVDTEVAKSVEPVPRPTPPPLGDDLELL